MCLGWLVGSRRGGYRVGGDVFDLGTGPAGDFHDLGGTDPGGFGVGDGAYESLPGCLQKGAGLVIVLGHVGEDGDVAGFVEGIHTGMIVASQQTINSG
jgi:hypothetical protein